MNSNSELSFLLQICTGTLLGADTVCYCWASRPPLLKKVPSPAVDKELLVPGTKVFLLRTGK